MGSGFYYADDGDGQGLLDVFEGKGGCGVAGDDEQVRALFVEELGAGDGVTGDGFVGLGAVGKPGGVAEVDVVGVGDEGKQSAEDGEAAEAGVEDAYGGDGWFHSVVSVLSSRFSVLSSRFSVLSSPFSVPGSQCGSIGGVGLAAVSVAG